METELAHAVGVVMTRAKRIFILIIKVNKLFSFFSSRCFLKEIQNMYQSGAFPLLDMVWSADQNKQLSNHSVNLESREVRPIKLLIVSPLSDSGPSDH